VPARTDRLRGERGVEATARPDIQDGFASARGPE
jgi:hypothetical protein